MIQSIERAVAILEIIAQEGGAAHLRHIAEKTGLGKTTVHNILKTLDELGYVSRRIGDMRYHLGNRILNLARIAGDDSALRTRLRPVLERIAEKTGETVYLGVPSGDEIYYLAGIESGQMLKTSRPPAERERLEGSAVGLVFLAFMPGLRKRVLATRADAFPPDIVAEFEKVATVGYALDLEASSPGLHCVAVPWRENGEVRAGIALSGPSIRMPRQTLPDLAWLMMNELDKMK
jgi:IclR family acetate operon transcriptional repressor